MDRARTWLWSGAVLALVLTAVALLVAPTPASSWLGRQESPAPGPDARSRAVTPVGNAELRAEFGPKPNVVVVMADDLRADDVRWMPTVRRVLREGGVEFRNAFSTHPESAPARASYFSGRLTQNHGVVADARPWGFGAFEDEATIATAMQQAGYRTALVGEYLAGSATPPSYFPPGWTDWDAAEDLSPSVAGDIATSLVGDFADSEAPFFLHLGLAAPALDATGVAPSVRARLAKQVTKAPGFGGDADPSEVDVRDKPVHVRALPEPTRALRAVARERALRRAESLFLVDRQVARLVATLRQRGEWERTVLVLTGDNGVVLGEHRILGQTVTPYEPSTRVPLLLTGPGLRGGTHRDDPITTVDLTATILELGRAMPYLTEHHALDGAGRVTTLLDGDQGWRFPVVVQGRSGTPSADESVRRVLGFTSEVTFVALRTPRYAYVRHDGGDHELYDLRVDPHQLTNVFSSADYAEVTRALRGIWAEYAGCAGRLCRLDLPDGLRADPTENAELTSSYWKQVARRAAATLTP